MPFSNYWRPDPNTVVPLAPREVRRVTPQPRKEYHTLIPGCAEIAGAAVKDKKVKLTAAQAQYWIDQGALGEQAGEHRAGAALGKKPKKM